MATNTLRPSMSRSRRPPRDPEAPGSTLPAIPSRDEVVRFMEGYNASNPGEQYKLGNLIPPPTEVQGDGFGANITLSGPPEAARRPTNVMDALLGSRGDDREAVMSALGNILNFQEMTNAGIDPGLQRQQRELLAANQDRLRWVPENTVDIYQRIDPSPINARNLMDLAFWSARKPAVNPIAEPTPYPIPIPQNNPIPFPIPQQPQQIPPQQPMQPQQQTGSSSRGGSTRVIVGGPQMDIEHGHQSQRPKPIPSQQNPQDNSQEVVIEGPQTQAPTPPSVPVPPPSTQAPIPPNSSSQTQNNYNFNPTPSPGYPGGPEYPPIPPTQALPPGSPGPYAPPGKLTIKPPDPSSQGYPSVEFPPPGEMGSEDPQDSGVNVIVPPEEGEEQQDEEEKNTDNVEVPEDTLPWWLSYAINVGLGNYGINWQTMKGYANDQIRDDVQGPPSRPPLSWDPSPPYSTPVPSAEDVFLPFGLPFPYTPINREAMAEYFRLQQQRERAKQVHDDYVDTRRRLQEYYNRRGINKIVPY